MEYLFAISLILVVAIGAIGYFGQQVKQQCDENNTSIGSGVKGPN